MKKLLSVYAALALLACASSSCRIVWDEPTPDPSASITPSETPSPVPSAVPSASPSPSAPPVVAATIELKGVVGETVGGIYVTDTWLSQTVPAGVKAYEIQKVETKMPSFKGAAVGFYEDPLRPVTEIGGVLRNGRYWIEAKLTQVGTQQFGELITAQVKAGPMATMPFYSELSHDNVGKTHNIPDEGTTQGARFAKTKLYMELLREHGVEPVKQWVFPLPLVKNGKLDLDTVTANGTGASYREMILAGAIASPMIVGPNLTTLGELTLGATLNYGMAGWGVTSAQIEAKQQVTQAMVDARHAAILAFTNAIKASIAAGELPPDSYAYAWDEGEGVVDDLALARAKLLKLTGLRVMETRNVTDTFRPYVDWFFPVISAIKPGWVLGGAYVSCMSQGNCQPKSDPSQVAPWTGYPMFVLDAPLVNFRVFPLAIAKLGAPRGLYFMSNKLLKTAWLPGGQYNEGGNGDGTFLYPGTDGNPWPSLRLKLLYRGLQDAWYAVRSGQNLVTDGKTWPQDMAAYEAARLAAWSSLP